MDVFIRLINRHGCGQTGGPARSHTNVCVSASGCVCVPSIQDDGICSTKSGMSNLLNTENPARGHAATGPV